MQPPETVIHVVGLLARVVCLDDKFIGSGGMVAGGEDVGAEELGEEREEGGGWDAEGGF